MTKKDGGGALPLSKQTEITGERDMRDRRKAMDYMVEPVENGFVIHDRSGEPMEVNVRGRMHVAETPERLRTVLMELTANDIERIVAAAKQEENSRIRAPRKSILEAMQERDAAEGTNHVGAALNWIAGKAEDQGHMSTCEPGA